MFDFGIAGFYPLKRSDVACLDMLDGSQVFIATDPTADGTRWSGWRVLGIMRAS